MGPCISQPRILRDEDGGVIGSPTAKSAGGLARISIADGKFMQGGEEVVLLGGNYVLKAQPYFPPAEVVRANARAMVDGAQKMAYKPSDGRKVVPVVRLGVLWEGAMPSDSGEIDPAFAAQLQETVQAFADEGVYVFLDAHQDAFCTTNGGEGFPWWITAKMQDTAGWFNESYITSSDHPLRLAIPDFLQDLLTKMGVPIPSVRLADESDPDPWRAYSVGGNAGNPAHMNVGNVNMRPNNSDSAWGAGTLTLTAQVQNVAHRFWNSHASSEDRQQLFEPYMNFIRFLCSAWEANSNVVAVEIFNEPPLGGLPSFTRAMGCRRDLFNFYGAVLEALDGDAEPTKAPLAFQDLGGTVAGASLLMTLIETFAPIDATVAASLAQWSERGQLVFSFHYYPGIATSLDLAGQVAKAQEQAASFGNPPLFLSEYWTSDAQSTADTLAQAAELGCGAVAYWHYADMEFTQTEGWFRYTPEIMAIGAPVDSNGNINWESWRLYEETVAAGTFWGANITGAEGAKQGVLALVPAAGEAAAPRELGGRPVLLGRRTALPLPPLAAGSGGEAKEAPASAERPSAAGGSAATAGA